MSNQVKVRRAVELSDPAFGAMQAFVLAADIGVLCFDVDLVICSVHGSVFAGDGWSPELLVGRPLADALPAAQVTLLRPPYEAALRGQRSRFALPACYGRGRIEISVEPVRVLGGTIVGGIALARELPAADAGAHEARSPSRETTPGGHRRMAVGLAAEVA